MENAVEQGDHAAGDVSGADIDGKKRRGRGHTGSRKTAPGTSRMNGRSGHAVDVEQRKRFLSDNQNILPNFL